MKKILYITIIVLTIAGCKKVLDLSPSDQISQASFWNTSSDLQMSTNYLYQGMNHTWNVDEQSEDNFGTAPNNVSSGTYVAGNADGVWNNAYADIRQANEFLENYQKAQVSDSIKNRYAGVAKFFRAYYYFELVARFGDVPLIMKTLDLSSPELYGPRTDRSIVIDSVIADLQWAAQYLPLQSQLASTETGAVTSGTAQALLSRVALFEGTWEKYHSGSDPTQLLTIAKNAALQVMQSKQYALYPNFLTLFYFANENNPEVILSYQYSQSVSGSDYNLRVRSMLLDGSLCPTKYLADAFRCTDGLPISESPEFQGYGTMESEFENRDPRMAMEIWKPGDDYDGSAFTPDLTVTRTGYWPKKYCDPLGFTQAYIFTNEILIRYAEVLLNYAEATYELSGSISDDDLNISINLLRARAGMPPLTNAFVNGANAASVKLNMLDEIRTERRVELAEEGFRYDDLRRWAIADTELAQQILGAKFHPADYPNIKVGTDININADSFIVTQTAASRSFADPQDYLFPIPLGQIALDPKLTQNPGW